MANPHLVADGGQHRGHRHGQERSHDPDQDRAGGQDAQDHGGVQGDGTLHDGGLEQVGLDLLDGQHDQGHDQCGLDALVREGDEDGEEPGHEGADHRHERPEEDQHGQWQHQRYVQDEQADTDADRVEQGHQRGPTDEPRQRDPAPLARCAQVVEVLRRGDASEPVDDLLPVLDEEEQQHQRQRHGGEPLGHGDGDRAQLGRDLAERARDGVE